MCCSETICDFSRTVYLENQLITVLTAMPIALPSLWQLLHFQDEMPRGELARMQRKRQLPAWLQVGQAELSAYCTVDVTVVDTPVIRYTP